MFLMQDAEHFASLDLERMTNGYGHGRGRAHRSHSRHRFLAKKVSGRKHRYRGLFTPLGDDRELCPAILEIKHSVGWASLGKESLFCRVVEDASSRSFSRQKNGGVKGPLLYCCHRNILLPHAVRLWISHIMVTSRRGQIGLPPQSAP